MKKAVILLLITLLFLGCGNKEPTVQPVELTSADKQVRYIGQKKDVDGTLLDGFAILHPRRLPAKPDSKGKPNKAGENACFSFLSGSAIPWKVAEPYMVDTTNRSALDAYFITNSIQQAILSWDSQVGFTIFGPEVLSYVDRTSIGNVANGRNELMFAAIDEPNVIAITYIWGIFRGSPQNRELREWDMVYDDVDFQFGDAGPLSEDSLGNTNIIDLVNILTHEFGHALGLGHPMDSCTEESMFRFSEEGETKKRSLHAGDVAGVKAIYQ